MAAPPAARKAAAAPTPAVPVSGGAIPSPRTGRPTGARVQARRQMRQVARLRAATMILAVLAVVGAPALFFGLREATRDPVFAELDQWPVPGWAAGRHVDGAYGSRWCIKECRFRERTWDSARSAGETDTAFRSALRRQGWIPLTSSGCAGATEGLQTCWQRDELVLILWVRDGVCPAPSGTADPTACPTAIATVKVFNSIAFHAAASAP